MFEGVTVLMPVYNGAAFLREAIDSVLNQTFKHFEFLIIDDGSTDETIDIIRSYSDERIRLILNDTNIGITKTLNKGIELASFELIARMDADDLCYHERLQKQYEAFTKKPQIALSATWAREFFPDGSEIVYELNPDYYYYNLVCECWIYHPTVMYRKSVIQLVGGYQHPYCEDFDLWWRISRNFEIEILPQVLLDYRYTENSISRNTMKKENSDAHREQLIRNVHFYAGTSLTLSTNDIDFLVSNFDSICKNNKINVLIKHFRKLEQLDSYIFKKDKQKYPLEKLKRAAYDKKDRITFSLLFYYSFTEITFLLLRLGYLKLLRKYLIYGVNRLIKN